MPQIYEPDLAGWLEMKPSTLMRWVQDVWIHTRTVHTAALVTGSDSLQNFRGDGQLVALEVVTELTQMVEIGDFFPKLVTEKEEARE